MTGTKQEYEMELNIVPLEKMIVSNAIVTFAKDSCRVLLHSIDTLVEEGSVCEVPAKEMEAVRHAHGMLLTNAETLREGGHTDMENSVRNFAEKVYASLELAEQFNELLEKA